MSAPLSFSERRRRHKIKISFIMEVVHLVVLARKDPQSAEARQEDLVTRLNELLDRASRGWSSVLFDGESVFVDGQVLCVEEALHNRAQRIMHALTRLNVYEVQFQAPLAVYDVQRLLAYLLRQQPLDGVEQTLSPRLRVRSKSASILASWDLTLDPGELCARTCATALVVMRGFYDRALQGDLTTLPHVKRVAQNMVVLTERYPAMLLAILGALPARQEVPTLVTKSAVLAVMMMRRLTRDRRNIIDVAMSALLYDMGTLQLMREEHPVISYRDTEQFTSWSTHPPKAIASRLPVAAASMVTRLGEMGEASLARSIYLYESLEMIHQSQRQSAYPATLEAAVLTTARQFVKQLAPVPDAPRVSPPPMSGASSRVDRAIAALQASTTRRADRLVVEVLLEGLGLVGRGEKVVLSSGYKGVVVANHERPSCFSRPVVRMVRAPDDEAMRPACDVDLSLPTQESAAFGSIESLIRDPDELLDQARERLLRPSSKPPRPRLLDAFGKKKKSFERVPKPVVASLTQEQTLEEPSEEDIVDDAITQIRKAPHVLAQVKLDVESLLDETQEDLAILPLIEVEADITQDILSEDMQMVGGNLSWDESEDTSASASAPSDRIQMLKASDIAHMMPEELLSDGDAAVVNQDFSVAPFLRKSYVPTQEVEEDVTIERIGPRDMLNSSIVSLESFTSRSSSGPEDAFDIDEVVSMSIPSMISMSPETWDNLHDDLDEESSITGPSSDRHIVLGDMPEDDGDDGDYGPQDTALLPPNVVDALMTRDRRRHVFGTTMADAEDSAKDNQPEKGDKEKSGK